MSTEQLPKNEWTIIPFDTVELTSYTITVPSGTTNTRIWVDDYGGFSTHSPYTGGTKLLRDAAQAAEDYNWKKVRSRSGWKSRYELRNV